MQRESQGGLKGQTQGQAERVQDNAKGKTQGQAERVEDNAKGKTQGQAERVQDNAKGKTQGQAERDQDKTKTQTQADQDKAKGKTQGQAERDQDKSKTQTQNQAGQDQGREQERVQGGDRDRVQQGEREGRSSNTSVSFTSEQRTKIRETVFKERNAPRVSKVDFSLNVGTVVPRTVHIVEVPEVIVSVHPEWRGYPLLHRQRRDRGGGARYAQDRGGHRGLIAPGENATRAARRAALFFAPARGRV